MSIDTTPAPIGADALSVAAQVALAEYANPLNWEADENGIRRIWREPDSCTPDAYDGFKLARAALASAAQPQAATDYSACASADSNYAAGMLIGWNLCVAGDEASFGRIREDRMRAAIQASRAAKTTLASAAQPAAVQEGIPEGCTPADARVLREANHALAAESYELQEVLIDLHGQVMRFCEARGEADFETGRASALLHRLRPAEFQRPPQAPSKPAAKEWGAA